MAAVKVQRARTLPKGESYLAQREGRRPRYNWNVVVRDFNMIRVFTFTSFEAAVNQADRIARWKFVDWTSLVGVAAHPHTYKLDWQAMLDARFDSWPL